MFREFFSLAGLVGGLLSAASFAGMLASQAATYWKFSPLVLKGAAFVMIFFLVYFFLSLAGWLLHRSEKMLFLKTVNRAGGVAIGIGKGAALAALAVFFLAQTSWLPGGTRGHLEGSYLVAPLSRLAENLIRIGKERIFEGESSDRALSPGPQRL